MKHKNRSTLFTSVSETMQKHPFLTALLILSLVLTTVLTLLPPLFLAGIINGLTGGRTDFLYDALLYFLFLALAGISDSLQEIMITVYGQKITHSMRSSMCGKLSRLPVSYFTKNEAGKTASRFVNDVDTMEALFSDGVMGMFANAFQVIGIISVIWIKSRGLGILLLLVTPLLFFMTRSFQRGMLKAQMLSRAAVAKVNGHLPETIRNIRMIHSFGKESYMENRYDGFIRDQYRATEKSNFYDSVYSPIIVIISTAMTAVMMVMAAGNNDMRALFGMDAGTAVAVIAYVGRIFTPIENIGMEIQNIQSAVAGKKRIDEFMQEPERYVPKADAGSVLSKTSSAECITLSDVGFSYRPGEPVLNHVSFSVRSGENVTITGRTGIGKSTLFRLLLGLYEPQSGNIRIYGTDARDIPDSNKRGLFGYVEQSFYMVNGTVAEQISLFDSSISRERIEKAAELAGLGETIRTMEKGYDTVCRPNLFSEGQLQLLSVARAVVSDPSIMLLDEITANLDSSTEKKVMDALKKASENRTVLSISHRSTARTGSRIIELH